jgi:hypothetical protein
MAKITKNITEQFYVSKNYINGYSKYLFIIIYSKTDYLLQIISFFFFFFQNWYEASKTDS